MFILTTVQQVKRGEQAQLFKATSDESIQDFRRLKRSNNLVSVKIEIGQDWLFKRYFLVSRELFLNFFMRIWYGQSSDRDCFF